MSLVPKHIKKLSPYKPGKTIDFVKREYNLDVIIKLASNENPLGPSMKSLNAISKMLKNSHRYPDASGYLLRKKLADKFNVKIDNVVLGGGSEGIMSSIIRTFLKERDELISAKNSFIGFRVLANASGRKVHWVPMINYKYNLEGIVKKINTNTKIIYIANPDNPTGTYITVSQFDTFMKKVPDRVLVILDEAYFEYACSVSDYPDSMVYRYDNVITLRTFSKIYGLAGLRIGYGFAHKSLIDNLMKVKLPFEPSSVSQEAALLALEDKEHIQKSIQVNLIEKERLINVLNKIGLNYIPSIANFITIIFKNRDDVINCSNYLLANGIIIRDLIGFGLPDGMRVTIGTNEENLYFIQKLKKYINN
jgi:histidinol-phosphate aminotransferase